MPAKAKRITTVKSQHRKISQNYSKFIVQCYASPQTTFYYLMLELNGILKSWRIPKGPSLNPKDKRLAVQAADQPVNIYFSETSSEENSKPIKAEIWDEGNYLPVDEKSQPITNKQALQQLSKGELKFILNGKKFMGGFVLVKAKSYGDKNWLLIKHRDEYAVN